MDNASSTLRQITNNLLLIILKAPAFTILRIRSPYFQYLEAIIVFLNEEFSSKTQSATACQALKK